MFVKSHITCNGSCILDYLWFVMAEEGGGSSHPVRMQGVCRLYPEYNQVRFEAILVYNKSKILVNCQSSIFVICAFSFN